MAARTAVPRPSGPWQAMQRVLKVAPAARIFSACAAVLTVATGSAEGNTTPAPAVGEGCAGAGVVIAAMAGVEFEMEAACCGGGPASRSAAEVVAAGLVAVATVVGTGG